MKGFRGKVKSVVPCARMRRLRLLATITIVLAVMAFSNLRPDFEPVQPDSLRAAGTFVNAFADYDGDGDLDLFVGLGGTPNRLYRNDRGTLVNVAAEVGVADALATRAAAWGDFDADGDPDLLLGFAPGPESVVRLYRNDRGKFFDVTAASGLVVGKGAVRQPAWVDVDGDNDLDLFLAFRDRANALFRNDSGPVLSERSESKKRFTDIAPESGLADSRRSVGAVWFDYDEDGDLDVYVAHMDGEANALYKNDGGRYTDVSESTGVAWGGRVPRLTTNGTVRPCAADVDGDGRLDLFTANYGPNGLFLNRGKGAFEDVSEKWGIAIDSRYDTCAFSDFDHDGRLDLYINGTVTSGVSYRDYLFRNIGTGFEDVTPDLIRNLQADHGAQWADFDGDGDEDLALTGVGADPMPLLLRNRLPQIDAGRRLEVRVVDRRGRATRAGAEVRLFLAGTRRLLGTRLVDTGSGYDAQNDMPVHFGLTNSARVDVEVMLPTGSQRLVSLTRNVDQRAQKRPLVVRIGS
jgi:hypothetical protein